MNKLGKIIFVLLTIISIVPVSYAQPKMSIEELGVTDAYKYLVEYMKKSKVINYNNLLDSVKYDKNAVRYTDTTPDVEIKWNVKKYENVDSKMLDNDINGMIQLDGKKISLPIKFDYFGNAYKNFASIEFSNVKATRPEYGVRIVDEINGTYIATFSIDNDKNKIFMLYNKEKQNKFNFILDTSSKIQNKIIGIYTSASDFATKSDLRVKGIGIGNTYNEMYAKFGKPTVFENVGEKTYACYICVDEKSKKMYLLYFSHDNSLRNEILKVKGNPRKNVITTVLLVNIPYMEGIVDYVDMLKIIEDTQKSVLVKQA